MNYTGETLTTAPATEPVLLGDLKTQLRIDTSVDDDNLNDLIASARDHVEAVTGRALITQTWTIYYDSFPRVFELPHPPLVSVTHIKYYDIDDADVTVGSSVYDVDVTPTLGVIRRKSGQSWPTTTLRPTKGVEVKLIAGYGDRDDIPGTLAQAIVLHVRLAYFPIDPLGVERLSALLAPKIVKY